VLAAYTVSIFTKAANLFHDSKQNAFQIIQKNASLSTCPSFIGPVPSEEASPSLLP